MSDRKYWACRFVPTRVEDAADMPASVMQSTDGLYTRIRRLRMRDDFDQDLFKLEQSPPETDSLFCSQRFLEIAKRERFKGIALLMLRASTGRGNERRSEI